MAAQRCSLVGGMSISPFSARPSSPEAERRRAKLVVLIATVGIAATLLAYAVSPSVRHAVHSVKGAVSHALDHEPAAVPALQIERPRTG